MLQLEKPQNKTAQGARDKKHSNKVQYRKIILQKTNLHYE